MSLLDLGRSAARLCAFPPFRLRHGFRSQPVFGIRQKDFVPAPVRGLETLLGLDNGPEREDARLRIDRTPESFASRPPVRASSATSALEVRPPGRLARS